MSRKGLAPDDFGVAYIRHPIFFWTLDQIDTMLGMSQGWARKNSRVQGDRMSTPADRRKLVIVDITPDEDQATFRVRHEELIRFCRLRGITFNEG